MIVNGTTYDLSGSCPSPSYAPNPHPVAHSYDAFVAFVAKLNDLANWQGITLGPKAPWNPDHLLVIAAPPTQDIWTVDSQSQTSESWPFGPYGTWGVPWLTTAQCGITNATQTSQLLPLVQGVPDSTRFLDPVPEARVLGLRPILPGETTTGICP